MKRYKITAVNTFGEQFVVTINAGSIREALQCIEVTVEGWNVAQVETI